MALWAMISRGTLSRLESGSPEVTIGIYATVLFILGLEQKLSDLADIRIDDIGLDLEEERLPKRIRVSKQSKGEGPVLKRSTMP
jgi:hypothetical protein